MGITEQLYIQLSGSEQAFTRKPTQEFEPGRFIQGLPAWRLPNGEIIKEKKMLVLYMPDIDWDKQRKWNPVILEERLRALEAQGFRIYQYKFGTVEPFDYGDLGIGSNEPKTKAQLLNTKRIAEKASAELKVSPDHIFVLTSDNYTDLIKGDEADYAEFLNSNHFDLAKSNLSMDSLRTLLLHHQEQITYLDLSGCLNLEGELQLPHLHLPNLNTLIFKKMVCGPENDKRLCGLKEADIIKLLNASPALKILDLSGFTTTIEMLKSIQHPETLESLALGEWLDSRSIANSLLELLSKANLKSLSLLSLYGDSLKYVTSALEALTLSENYGPRLNTILSRNSKTLKTLNLNKNRVLHSETIIFPPLPALEILNLNNSKITTSKLEKILKNTKKLKELHLSDCKGIDTNFDETLDLSVLEVLDLSKSAFSLSSLEKILKNAANLKKLTLSECQLTGEIKTPLNLRSLEEINLDSTELYFNSLDNLIRQSHQLRKIRMDGCNHIHSDQPISFHFPVLTQLSANNSSLNARTLEAFVKEAKEIKALDLCSCFYLAVSFEMNEKAGEMPLKLIEKFDYSQRINLSMLENFKHSSQLKKLTINMTSADIDITQPFYLISLVDIIIDGNLSEKSIINLLKNSKKLNKLSIYNNQAALKLFSTQIDLSGIRSLRLQGSNVTTDALVAILQQSTKINQIYLEHCNHLTADNTKKIPLEHLGYLKVLKTKISGTLLSSMLENATHLRELTISESEVLNKGIHRKIMLFSLEKLKIEDTSIHESLFVNLLSNASYLKKIVISNGNLIQDSPSDTELLNLHQLEKIKIHGPGVSKHLLKKLMKHAPNLKELLLDPLTSFSEQFFNELLEKHQLNRLVALTVPFRPTKALIEKLKQKAPHLKTLEVSEDWESAGFISPLRNNDSRSVAPLSNERINRPHNALAESVTPFISPPKKVVCDADTTLLEGKIFSARRFFYDPSHQDHPPVTSYCLDLYDTITPNPDVCDINNAFTWSLEGDLNLRPREVKQVDEDTYNSCPPSTGHARIYYGNVPLSLSNEWVPLPALSAYDKIHAYHVSGNSPVEIQYSAYDNRHYVRAKNSTEQTITFDFIVEVPKQLPSIRDLPKDIQANVFECLHFKSHPLKGLDGRQLNGYDYLDELTKQRVGACRQRVLVFKTWMKAHYPNTKVFISTNDPHAFIWLFHNNQWVSCDLGGYPAELDVQEITLPKKPEKQASEPLPPNPEEPRRIVKEKLLPSGKVVRKDRYFPLPEKSTPASANAYFENLFHSDAKRQLLLLDSTQAIHHLRYALQRHCTHTHRPYYVINSPDDLVCASDYIERVGNLGIPRKGPGGPFYDFLMAHQHDAPLILLNYDNFTPEEIVRHNTLFEGTVDGIPLPKNTRLIGLMNPNAPNAYDGKDLYSRLDTPPTPCPLKTDDLPPLPPLPKEKSLDDGETLPIELFGGASWENTLKGGWEPQGQTLNAIESELHDAVDSGKLIELKNTPWASDQFLCFWQEYLLKGNIKPEQVVQCKGYDWKTLTQGLTLEPTPFTHQKTAVLNPSTLTDFIKPYACDPKTLGLIRKPGLLPTHQAQTLDVYLSRSLTENDWARFLSTAQENQVRVNLSLAPNVQLPAYLTNALPEHEQNTKPKALATSRDYLLLSHDLDFAVANLNAPIIIDVSELEPDDLLNSIDAAYNTDTQRFRFVEKTGFLNKALKKEKTVVLKGPFSDRLNDALASFLLKRQHEKNPKGQIILATEKPICPFLPTEEKIPTAHDKQQLVPDLPLSLDAYDQKPLVMLQAMKTYQNLHPEETDLQQAWLGLVDLPPTLPDDKPLDLQHATEEARAFDQRRIHAVEALLDKSPFAFLAGKTGSGKTTFMDTVWKKKYPNLFIGEKDLLKWAQSDDKGLKVLFIDEANISKLNWTQFESLFNNPPGILINGRYIQLSPEHNVVFAGNPLAYGGERTLPSLFKRHGNTILFSPLPPAYLYEYILSPTLKAIPTVKPGALAEPFLNVARFLSDCDPNEVLISPRELKSMALLTVSYCKRYPDQNPIDVARFYAYQLSHAFVPPQHQEAFLTRFNGEIPPLPRDKDRKPANIHISPRNQNAINTLNDFLELRALKQANPGQFQGGLGGVVLEGDSSLGKSHITIKTLLAHGFVKGNPNHDNTGKNVFYPIPASLPTIQKQRLLKKAFHEGVAVVMDEMNCAPALERQLNAYLMGKTPKGKSPNIEGFLALGTQNPLTLAGRRQITQASKHRVCTINMPPHTNDDERNILYSKEEFIDLPHDVAEDLLNEYFDKKDRLCLRDLLTRAEQEAKALGVFREPQSIDTTPDKLQETSETLDTNNQSIPTTQLAQAEPLPTPPCDPDRLTLLDGLQNYIHYIEKMNGNFAHGFFFFKRSRAVNREINYLLAKSLFDKLSDPNRSIKDVFEDIDAQRNATILENHFLHNPNYVNRGLNSNNLLKVIKQAEEMIEVQNNCTIQHN